MSIVDFIRFQKKLFLYCLVFFSASLYSQTILNLQVKDSITGEPLSYCNVLEYRTKMGGITNEEGQIRFKVDSVSDVLMFSYLGYENLKISASRLIDKSTVYLIPKLFNIQEVTVTPDNNFLYEIVTKCRKQIQNNKSEHVSKVFYQVETESKDEPIELLECYYNGVHQGQTISEIKYKAGRVALATMDGNYFLTRSSSFSMAQIDIIKNNKLFPLLPLQLRKKELQKLFELQLISSDTDSYTIKFYPKVKSDCFSGEMWINKRTSSLQKITFQIEETNQHPFIPMFPGDSIGKISIFISNVYKVVNQKTALDYIHFDYKFVYKSVRDTPQIAERRIIHRPIHSKGVLYFYDYNLPFIPNFFDYNKDLDDYRLLSFIPYNEHIWENEKGLVLTEQQKQNIGILSKQGQIINYRDFNEMPRFNIDEGESKNHFFHDFFVFWQDNKRVVLSREKGGLNEVYPSKIINQRIPRDLYQLKVQILLDAYKVDSTIQTKSYTVFDFINTFYHLPENEYTRAFINIYFDVCEIERRKMQANLDSKLYSRPEIESIYKTALKNIELIGEQYFKEVSAGKDLEGLTKWNLYVQKELGIDNIQLEKNSLEK